MCGKFAIGRVSVGESGFCFFFSEIRKAFFQAVGDKFEFIDEL